MWKLLSLKKYITSIRSQRHLNYSQKSLLWEILAIICIDLFNIYTKLIKSLYCYFCVFCFPCKFCRLSEMALFTVGLTCLCPLFRHIEIREMWLHINVVRITGCMVAIPEVFKSEYTYCDAYVYGNIKLQFLIIHRDNHSKG